MRMPFRIRISRNHGESFSTRLSVDQRLLALGTRTVADLVAPAGAEIHRDRIQLETQHVRVLVVTGYPRTVAAGWLAPLVEELDLPLELSLHIRPLQSGDMIHPPGHQA